MKKKTIRQLVIDFFKTYPNIEFEHAPVVDWVTEQRIAMGYDPPRDVWRMVRQLHQEGMLIKVQQGVYKYDPNYEHETELQDFPESIKHAIFERDNYRCVVCNLGTEDGVSLAADHKKPKSKGGTNTLENGQTLCNQHNTLKKNYSQTEAGKRYFIKMYETALENNDRNITAFCESVFDAYDQHGVNGHIQRPDRK